MDLDFRWIPGSKGEWDDGLGRPLHLNTMDNSPACDNQVDNGSVLARTLVRNSQLSLTVTSRVEGSCAVLDLNGQLTLGPALGAVRDAAKRALGDRKVSGLLLLMGGVTVADSSGLGELTVVYSMAAKKGCPVRLVEASTSLRKMLQMTRIDELLPTSDTLTEAKSAIESP